jgi:RHS repeat-associated protein
VVTSNIGYLTHVYSYYPYGSVRLDEGTGTFTQPNQYIGQDRDTEADLSYLNARYYRGVRGQFLSQDPVFWSTNQNLANPQSLNSYSYAENNPVNKKDPSGLAPTVKGSLKETQKALIKVLKSYISLLESARSNPGGTAKSLARSAGSTAKNVVFNPGGMAYDGAVSARNSFNTFRNGSDAVQDQMIGNGVAGLAGLFLPKGVKRIPDDAIVVRGGGPSNFASDRFKIGESRTPGVIGWSAQCAPGACAQTLANNLPNTTVAQTTASTIRAAGGDVIKTNGPGEHVTVTGLDGNASSNLSWDFFTNNNPWQK